MPDGLLPGQQFIVNVPVDSPNRQARAPVRGLLAASEDMADHHLPASRLNYNPDREFMYGMTGRRGFGDYEMERARNERRRQRRERLEAEASREDAELQMVLTMSAETAFFEQVKRDCAGTRVNREGLIGGDEEEEEIDENAKVLRECEVCLDDIKVGHRLRTLPCMHVFHAECANVWLR